MLHKKYVHKRRLSRYRGKKGTGINKILARLSGRAGFKFSNHTFRRTFGRTLWQAGVELETIMKSMGHEDRKTTIDHLWKRMDDMMGAMQKLAVFQDARNPGERTIENRPNRSLKGEK